ncbi:hypothetical protein RIR_jg32404.t1 [Rhizophagus irregularis DAOM 181602=DAOM 197198]|nr:hypothetical protein RIR_jg32404.t1 [Rhizophagus irregularis DAOM 181602=DAOM 197198]
MMQNELEHVKIPSTESKYRMRICDICDAPPEILEINHSETKNDLQNRSSISNVDVSTENNLSFHKTISGYGGYRKSSYQEKVSK